MLSKTPNVIEARARRYPEQNTSLHPAITGMQSAFYLLLTLTQPEIIFKDPLLVSKIGAGFTKYSYYTFAFLYTTDGMYTNSLSLPH